MRDKLIEEAFAFFGMKPRDSQAQIVDDVLTAFIDKKKMFVVLNASTGIGKQIIGAVVARCIEKLGLVKPDDEISDKPGLFLVGTNTLTDQYADTFKGNHDFLLAKGAGNYPCTLMTERDKYKHTAESCESSMIKTLQPKAFVSHCENCEYMKIKKSRNAYPYLITNYSMFFINQLYSQIIKTRGVTIYDEAHTINDLFVEHMSIHHSSFALKKYYAELQEVFIPEKHLTSLSKLKSLLDNKKITDSNYKQHLQSFMTTYKDISTVLLSKAEKEKDVSTVTRYRKLYKKYFGLHCKIDDFFKFDYDHIFEAKDEEISLKPVFVNLFFKGIATSPYNLLMSATISEDIVKYMLGLDKADYEFIRADPVFDKKNKKVVFLDPISINYKTLQLPKTLVDISKRVMKVVKENKDKNGIVLVPSFKLGSEVAAAIRKSGVKVKVFEQSYGEKLSDILEQFKKCKDPSVLISPSIYEGVDLPGELSRYQIIVKAPFPSLGDKRIKHILENYPVVYELMTVLKLVQGVGRSIRNKDDYATTYILDSHAKRIFKGDENIWKNEFLMIDEKL